MRFGYSEVFAQCGEAIYSGDIFNGQMGQGLATCVYNEGGYQPDWY